MSSQHCVVGEAHGFDDSYYHKCEDCHRFSNDFVDISNIMWTKEELESNCTVKAFVKHWSEKH